MAKLRDGAAVPGAAVTPVSEESISVGMVEETILDGKASFLDTQFQQLYTEGKFSDVTLVVGKERFPAHKAMLAMSSGYFERMFYGGTWKESGSDEVKMEETPDCEQAFGTFLSYFYHGSVTLTSGTVVAVVTLADKYDVQGLKQICSRFIAGLLHQTNALESALRWVTFAEHIRMPDLKQSCYDLICYNLENVYKLPGWCMLSLEQLLIILKRPETVVSNEYIVFLAAQTWLQYNSKSSKDIISKVLWQVQFKNMTGEQLCQVEKSKLASLNIVQAHNLLTPYLYDAFKYVASCEGDKAHIQRIYTKGSSLSTAEFRCGNAELNPSSNSKSKYGWGLKKVGKGTYGIEITDPQLRSKNSHIKFKLILIIRDKDGNTLHILNDRYTADMSPQEPREEQVTSQTIFHNASSQNRGLHDSWGYRQAPAALHRRTTVKLKGTSNGIKTDDDQECIPHDVMYLLE